LLTQVNFEKWNVLFCFYIIKYRHMRILPKTEISFLMIPFMLYFFNVFQTVHHSIDFF